MFLLAFFTHSWLLLRASFRNLYLHAMPGLYSWVPELNFENWGAAAVGPNL